MVSCATWPRRRWGFRRSLEARKSSLWSLDLPPIPGIRESASLANAPPALKAVGGAGSFIGFGGEFSRPPLVHAVGNRLFATDGKTNWELFADAYGSWLRRVAAAPKKEKKERASVEVDDKGTIRWEKRSLDQPHLASAASFACDGVTLAVTIPTSHHLFLFACVGEAA